MRKQLIYLVYLLILFTSCEEKYTPAIDSVEGKLVVEAQITNDPSKSFVHLTKTRDFYSKVPAEPIIGAKVELVEVGGMTTSGNETGPGYFSFSVIPTSGRNYKIKITAGNDIYESEVVTMPPNPTISKFYTANKEEKIYITDGYGTPIAYQSIVRELYIDAPASVQLANYRFGIRAILEWNYYPPSTMGPPPPPSFGWLSFSENNHFILAGQKRFIQATQFEKQPLMTLPYNAKDLYLLPDTSVSGWIIIIDQYGTSKGSFEYHEKLNSQFAADGSLFDPIQTQIYGNITCSTDPSKIAFGYFDLNSYQQLRYYLNLSGPDGSDRQRQIYRYPLIPDEGKTIGFPPDWWE